MLLRPSLDTLAAAYAEVGEFEKVVQWQKQAVKFTPANAKTSLHARLSLYRSNKPFRTSTPR